MSYPTKKPFNISVGLDRNNAILESVSVHYGFFSSAEIWSTSFNDSMPTLFHVSDLDDEIELWVKFSRDLRKIVSINILLSTNLNQNPNKGEEIIKDLLSPNL